MTWSTTPLPKDWSQTVDRILTRDNRVCYLGGCPATEVDHVIPRHLGGTHSDSNLKAICSPHHKQKTAREATEARRRKYSKRRVEEPHPGRIESEKSDRPGV